MLDLLAIKKNYTLLKTIPPEMIQDNIKTKLMNVCSYGKEQIIHFDGDICRNLEIVLLGKVNVERIDESGNLLTIAQFYPNDILGGNLVFSKNPYYPMTVTAKLETTILTIHKDLLFELCSNNNDFLKFFLENISDHALLLGDKIKHYVNRSIRESIVAFLRNEYRLQNSYKIQLNSTKKAIADRIGVQRTSLSRELQKMKDELLIQFDRISITIIDSDLLK